MNSIVSQIGYLGFFGREDDRAASSESVPAGKQQGSQHAVGDPRGGAAARWRGYTLEQMLDMRDVLGASIDDVAGGTLDVAIRIDGGRGGAYRYRRGHA